MSTMQRCAACRRSFRVRAQVRGTQRYCAAPACQRVRRKRWQRTKRHTDPDYRENQARAQEAWRDRHPGYWRTYRATHACSTAFHPRIRGADHRPGPAGLPGNLSSPHTRGRPAPQVERGPA